MLRLSLVLAGLAASAGFLWTGCGGDSAQTVTASSLSKAEFIERANAICARGRLRGLRYEPTSDPEPSERDAFTEGIQTILLPTLREVIDEIYELGAPAGVMAQTEKLLIAMQQGAEKAEELSAPTLVRVDELLAPAGKLAKRYGLESCIYG